MNIERSCGQYVIFANFTPSNTECAEYVGGFGKGFITVRRIFQGLWMDFLNSEDEAVNGV
jgi:hypothetical protein